MPRAPGIRAEPRRSWFATPWRHRPSQAHRSWTDGRSRRAAISQRYSCWAFWIGFLGTSKMYSEYEWCSAVLQTAFIYKRWRLRNTFQNRTRLVTDDITLLCADWLLAWLRQSVQYAFSVLLCSYAMFVLCKCTYLLRQLCLSETLFTPYKGEFPAVSQLVLTCEGNSLFSVFRSISVNE